MANCMNCRYAQIEDIWHEWDCLKSMHINTDNEGFLQDEEFDCQKFEELTNR